MDQEMWLRVRQVLDHCVLSVTSTVSLPRTATEGLEDGDPVRVTDASVETLRVVPGSGGLLSATLLVRLELDIAGNQRTAGVVFQTVLRLAGITCPGARLTEAVLNSAAGTLRIDSGRRFLRLPGPAQGGQFGFALSPVGDLDGDGLPELAVGAPSTPVGSDGETGRVYLYSLRTGDLIWQADGPDPGGEFGFAVASISDVDGDGVSDLVVGATETSPAGITRAGSAFVLSGADGSVIRRHDGAFAEGLFGWAVAGLDDWDGDGIPDYAVGAPSEDPGGMDDAGSVHVFSGATGSLIRRIDGLAAGEAFGFSLARAADLDGDGSDDLAVGAINASPPGLTEAGAVRVYNRSGALVIQAQGDEDQQGFGWSVAPIADWNGDSIPDLLVGAPSAGAFPLEDAGALFVISGATGAVLDRFDGSQAGESRGVAVAAIDDPAGDGRPAAGVSAPYTTEGQIPMAGTVVAINPLGTVVSKQDGSQPGAEWGWALQPVSGASPGIRGIAIGAPRSAEEAGESAGMVIVETFGPTATFTLALCLELSVEREVCLAVASKTRSAGR